MNTQNPWITSDLHFSHGNIRKYCPAYRSQLASVEEMDAALLAEWQSKVRPTDLVYFLGDMSFTHKDDTFRKLLNDLPGNIIWIMGNHDKHHKKIIGEHPRITVKDLIDVKFEGTDIVMCHYPLLSWNKMHHGSIQMHGHCHGSLNHLNVGTRRLDVGWDCFGRMLTLKEAVAMAKSNPIVTPEGDHHNTSRNM